MQLNNGKTIINDVIKCVLGIPTKIPNAKILRTARVPNRRERTPGNRLQPIKYPSVRRRLHPQIGTSHLMDPSRKRKKKEIPVLS